MVTCHRHCHCCSQGGPAQAAHIVVVHGRCRGGQVGEKEKKKKKKNETHRVSAMPTVTIVVVVVKEGLHGWHTSSLYMGTVKVGKWARWGKEGQWQWWVVINKVIWSLTLATNQKFGFRLVFTGFGWFDVVTWVNKTVTAKIMGRVDHDWKSSYNRSWSGPVPVFFRSYGPDLQALEMIEWGDFTLLLLSKSQQAFLHYFSLGYVIYQNIVLN